MFFVNTNRKEIYKEKKRSEIERAIRSIVYTYKGDKIDFISINHVDVNADFSVIKIYVSFSNEDEENRKYINELNRKNFFFKKRLISMIKIRKIPEIRFIFDKRFIINEKIEKILKDENF